MNDEKHYCKICDEQTYHKIDYEAVTGYKVGVCQNCGRYHYL